MDERRSREKTLQKGSSKDVKSEDLPQPEGNHLLPGQRHPQELIPHQEENGVLVEDFGIWEQEGSLQSKKPRN